MSMELNEVLQEDIPAAAQSFEPGDAPMCQAGEEVSPPLNGADHAVTDLPETDAADAGDAEVLQAPDESGAPDGAGGDRPSDEDNAPPDGEEKPKKKKAVKRAAKGRAETEPEAEPQEEVPAQADDAAAEPCPDDGRAGMEPPAAPTAQKTRHTQADAVLPERAKTVKRPATTQGERRQSLQGLDLRELDRDLSAEHQQEWNEIYASYRSKSVLTGTILGVDVNSYDLTNQETGRVERRKMHSAIIIQHRVKVFIPETEMWLPNSERPGFVLRNMVGGEIDYVIMEIDREGETAIASRRVAMAVDQHFFDSAKSGHRLGDKLQCRVLSVGPKRCLVECAGRDLTLSQRDLTYTATADLREHYRPGEKLPCILKEYVKGEKFWISVKEVTVNPFVGADKRHPVGSRRQAIIKGKYGGGVFCTLPDDTTCLCRYSPQHNDSDFNVGDGVIIAIRVSVNRDNKRPPLGVKPWWRS